MKTFSEFSWKRREKNGEINAVEWGGNEGMKDSGMTYIHCVKRFIYDYEVNKKLKGLGPGRLGKDYRIKVRVHVYNIQSMISMLFNTAEYYLLPRQRYVFVCVYEKDLLLSVAAIANF